MTPIDTSGSATTKAKAGRNWWKIAFFVALLLFEFAREWAVVASAEEAQPNSIKQVFGMDGYVIARGRWMRSDDGSAIVPSTVTIECRQDTGQCVEASVTMTGKFVFAPELDWFHATFARTRSVTRTIYPPARSTQFGST